MNPITNTPAVFTPTRFNDITYLNESIGSTVAILAKWTRQRLEEMQSVEPQEDDDPCVEDLLLYTNAIEASFILVNGLASNLATELEYAEAKIEKLTNEGGKEGKQK